MKILSMASSFYENIMFGTESTEIEQAQAKPKKPKHPERFYVDYKTWKHELELNPNTIGMQSGNSGLEMKVVTGKMYARYIAKTVPDVVWKEKSYGDGTFFNIRKKDSDEFTYWIKACGLPLTTEVILDNWET